MNKINPTPFIIVLIFITVVGFILTVNGGFQKTKSEHIKYVKIARQNIQVDLALTRAEQEKGLSGRSGLADNQGMLFVFNKPGKYAFWMKDMNFAIDMIWISQDGEVVYIKKDASPNNSLETYGPQNDHQDAKYVLEVAAGFSDTYDLKVGNKALFTY